MAFIKYFSFRSFIDQFFGGTFDVELKCAEAEEEPVAKSKEQFLQLSCFISQEVRYMHSGLRNVSYGSRKISLCFNNLYFYRNFKSKLLNIHLL